MLRVGIHENVQVSKAAINDHGTLEIEFLKPGNNDPMAALSGNQELSQDESVNIRLYGQNVEHFGTTRTGTQVLKLIIGFKTILTELLSAFIADPNIDAAKGLKITNENINVVFGDQKNVDKAYNNIVTQFVTQITPFLKNGFIRIKLPRKSEAVAFPTLPNFGPWVESMDITTEHSKIKWSNWEIENGKNDATIKKDVVTDKETSDDLKELDEVFAK